MEKFDFKDIVNYVVAGFLWYIIIIYIPIYIGKDSEFFKIYESIPSEGGIKFLITCYILRNIARVGDEIIQSIIKIFYGDIYENSIIKKEAHLLKITTLSKKIYYSVKCEMNNLGISSLTEVQLNELWKYHNEGKNYQKTNIKNETLLIETYLYQKQIFGKKERLKDLANLYISIIVPLTIISYLIQSKLEQWLSLILIILIITLASKVRNSLDLNFLYILCILILFTLSILFISFFIFYKNETNILKTTLKCLNTLLFFFIQITRYVYCKSNEIKETYKMFFMSFKN